MNSRPAGRAVLRGWWLIALVVAVVVLVTFAYTRSETPEYQASTKVYVAARSAGSPGDLAAGGTFVQQVVQSYADIATTSSVLRPVVRRLDLPISAGALAENVSVTVITGENLLQITATDRSRAQAVAIADQVAVQLSRTVTSLAPDGSAAAVRVTPIARISAWSKNPPMTSPAATAALRAGSWRGTG